MTSVCPNCRGAGKRGKQLCRRCNPSGALGDILLGWLGRLGDRLTGRRMTTDGKTTARRRHRFATETVALTPAERRARQTARQAKQRPQRKRKATGQRRQTGKTPETGTTPAGQVHGQQSSTAAETGRCGKCRGVYGLLKGGQVRKHKDLVTGRKCPGSGRPPKVGKPKPAQQSQRPAARPTQPPVTGPRPREATAAQLDPDRRRKVVDAVRVEYAADKLEPHEIFLAANGEIWIDRRQRDPGAVPFAVGRWRGQPGPRP